MNTVCFAFSWALQQNVVNEVKGEATETFFDGVQKCSRNVYVAWNSFRILLNLIRKTVCSKK